MKLKLILFSLLLTSIGLAQAPQAIYNVNQIQWWGLPNCTWTISGSSINAPCLTGSGGGSIVVQTNSVNNSSQSTLNLLNGSTVVGFTPTITNTSGGNVQFGLTAIGENANTFMAGPTGGGGGVPTWRNLVPADLPQATPTAFGAIKFDGTTLVLNGSNQLTAPGAGTGLQPPTSGTAILIQATTGSTVTIPANVSAIANNWIRSITNGIPDFTQPNFTNISGQATIAQLPVNIPNANLLNPQTIVNGQSCVLGTTCTVTATPSGLPASAVILSNSSGVAINGNGSVIQVNGKTVQRDINSPKDQPFNAKEDGIKNSLCSIATSTLSCTGYTFVSGDIGKLVIVYGAGPTLSPVLFSITSGDLNTTISSISGGNAILANSATTTVTNGVAVWGSDDTAAVNAINAIGGNIYYPSGIFMVNGTLPLASNSNYYCNNTSFYNVGSNVAGQGFQFRNVSNSSIHYCEIAATKTARFGGFATAGIGVFDSHDILMDTNNIHDFNSMGVIVSGEGTLPLTTYNIHLRAGTISNTLANATLWTHGTQNSDMKLVNCLNNNDSCMEATMYTIDTLPVQNIVFDSNISTNSISCGLADASIHIQYISNTCNNPTNNGFVGTSDSFSLPNLPSYIDFSNNTVNGSDTGSGGGFPSIYMSSMTHGKIKGNKLNGTGASEGIAIIDNSTITNSVSIKENEISNSALAAIAIHGNATGLSIEGNFVDTAKQCVSVANSTASVTHSTISTNHCNNINVGTTSFAAIDVNAGLDINGSGNVFGPPAGAWNSPIRIVNSTASSVLASSSLILSVGTPSAPTITQGGTGGASTYTYKTVGFLPDGSTTSPSATATTTTGNATLSGTNFNIATTAALTNSAYCGTWRLTGGTTIGFVGFSVPCGVAVNDTLPSLDGSAPPVATEGDITGPGSAAKLNLFGGTFFGTAGAAAQLRVNNAGGSTGSTLSFTNGSAGTAMGSFAGASAAIPFLFTANAGVVAGGTTAPPTNTVVQVNNGHISSHQTTAPIVAGTGCTIGTTTSDTNGYLTLGAGATSCTVTFNKTFAAGVCSVSTSLNSVLPTIANPVTTVATIGVTYTTGSPTVAWHCSDVN